jgi:acetyl-CoA synthetase
VLHTSAGYLLGATITAKHVFDLRKEDVYFCAADVGWIADHSCIVSGQLSNGATVLRYEGAPNHPGVDRFWEMIERHYVTVFSTAPTTIRRFMR